MIELGQPFQCLFCPQRRKLALMLKILLAFSTAAILGLILFSPRTKPVVARQDGRDRATTQSNEISPDKIQDSTEVNAGKVDLLLGKDREIQGEGQKRFHEVQAQLRTILSSKPINFSEARKLLLSRQREVLVAKILMIGDESFVGAKSKETEQKLMILSLDKEQETLAKQLELLEKAGTAH
jgi:hypothetical protein